MTNLDNALKALLIECAKRAFYTSDISINEYVDGNTPSSFTLVNNTNDISNMVCSYVDENKNLFPNGYITISIVNKNNINDFIDEDYDVSLEIQMNFNEDDLVSINQGALSVSHKELSEAGFDGESIFKRVNQLKNEYFKEHAHA